MAILRERKQVEVEAAIPRPEIPRIKSQGVQDADTLLNLLKIPAEQRTSADLTNICNQIRYSGIFQQLYISPHAETFLSRILDYRNFFHKGATVVHENCKNGSYFFILQGTLVVLPSRITGAQEAQEATKECYVLVVTVSEAMGIAPCDKSGNSDPYVIIKCGTQEHETEVKFATLNPIWDETIKIVNVNENEEYLELSVWDHDSWGDSDFIGLASVPLQPLKQNLHNVTEYAVKLRDDARYQVAADEPGVEYTISGTICFTAKLTTKTVLAQLQQLEEDADKSLKKTYLTQGDTFGTEQLLEENGRAPNTIIVEAPTTLLRVSAAVYQSEIVPLRIHELKAKKAFFRNMSVFSNISEQELDHLCRWFLIAVYKPGEVIRNQGSELDDIVLIMSGEVSVVIDVPDYDPHSRIGPTSSSPQQQVMNRLKTVNTFKDSAGRELVFEGRVKNNDKDKSIIKKKFVAGRLFMFLRARLSSHIYSDIFSKTCLICNFFFPLTSPVSHSTLTKRNTQISKCECAKNKC